MNSRTSGPPAFANLIVRDMMVSYYVVVRLGRSNCSAPEKDLYKTAR
jgi:hypothetical protein